MLTRKTKTCTAARCLQFSYRASIALACCVAVLQTGCGDKTRSASLDASSQSDRQVDEAASKPISPSTKSVLPDLQATERSPAAFNESDPRAVCRRFLELLQSNNRIAAENLLTKTALQVTGKAGLVLEPLSGPNCQYEIGDPKFATLKNEIAYVDCRITDLDHKSEISFSVSWIVKRQDSGWRISGLVMDMEDDRPRKMFSFENPMDVAEIKLQAAERLVDGKTANDSERQANLSNTEEAKIIK